MQSSEPVVFKEPRLISQELGCTENGGVETQESACRQICLYSLLNKKSSERDELHLLLKWSYTEQCHKFCNPLHQLKRHLCFKNNTVFRASFYVVAGYREDEKGKTCGRRG